MARKPNEGQRIAKRDMIVEKARGVFCKKGFLSVTMKDIVEVCGISRGGLYLFFSSVEELFQAVITSRNKSYFDTVRELIEENADFFEIYDIYFRMQKERLLNMEKSILRATYEYYSVHKEQPDIEFRNSQIAYIKKTILEILNHGIKQGAIENVNIEDTADSHIFLIEGMSVFGMFNNITEACIQKQVQLMKSMLKVRQ